MLPPRSFTLPAKATLVAVANCRDEAIVSLVRLKSTWEVHLIDLFAVEVTMERLYSHTVHEGWYDPVDCKGAAPSLSAGLFEFEGIGLESGCRLLPGPIIAPFFQHWNMMWQAGVGRYGWTRSWRTRCLKRRVEWCVMRGMYHRCHFGGDGTTLLWNLCWGSARAADLEGRGEWVVSSGVPRVLRNQPGVHGINKAHWYCWSIVVWKWWFLVGAAVDMQKIEMSVDELTLSQIRIFCIILYHKCAVGLPFQRRNWVFPDPLMTE